MTLSSQNWALGNTNFNQQHTKLKQFSYEFNILIYFRITLGELKITLEEKSIQYCNLNNFKFRNHFLSLQYIVHPMMTFRYKIISFGKSNRFPNSRTDGISMNYSQNFHYVYVMFSMSRRHGILT